MKSRLRVAKQEDQEHRQQAGRHKRDSVRLRPALLGDPRLALAANAGMRTEAVLALQAVAGNDTAVAALQRSVQARLKVTVPDDPSEREAERVANLVMRMPGYETEEEQHAEVEPGEVVHRAGDRGDVPPVDDELEKEIASLSGTGHALPENEKRFFESRMGYDFSPVRLHTGSAAETLAQRIQARAFTYGQHVVFGPGEFRPGTTEGRQLLAHELTHVIQQEPGRVLGGETSHFALSRTPSPAHANGTVTIRPVRPAHYNVTGNTLAEVAGQLSPEEWGRCIWNYNYRYDSANGIATRVDVTLTLTIRLPRWTGRGWRNASAAAKREWQRMLGCLQTHEDGHARIARPWARTLQHRLLNQPVANLSTIWEQVRAEHKNVQDEYDTRTQHGQTQGVTLDTSIQ